MGDSTNKTERMAIQEIFHETNPAMFAWRHFQANGSLNVCGSVYIINMKAVGNLCSYNNDHAYYRLCTAFIFSPAFRFAPCTKIYTR